MDCETECTPENACELIGHLMADVRTIWNDLYSINASIYIATGNIGIPVNTDLSVFPPRYENDLVEYAKGAAVINSHNPKGLFTVGGNNFDEFDLTVSSYPLFYQEAKFLNGFSQLMQNKRVFPVMGQDDYWIAQNTTGTINAKMANTLLRLFPNLPDAKRYYSVYDDATKTEFFILSSGRYRKPFTPYTAGFVYANDRLVGDDQYDWFAQRATASPAKNKIVIFSEPFTSITDVFDGMYGSATNFAYFDTWDFQSFGISLIINGHVGSSFHLKKGSVHIVNASAFSRSRMSMRDVGSNVEPPIIYTVFGQLGWVVEYASHQEMGTNHANYTYPGGDETDMAVAKNEFFKMTCGPTGILCEFISYNPYMESTELTIQSQVTENYFEILN